MKRRGLFCLLLLAAICQLAVHVRADGLVRDGVGPISTGRGGTNQGFADNAAIILDNPGAMVNVAGNGLAEFGADTVITDVHYTNPLNDSFSKIRPLPMPVLGYIKKSDDDRWAVGIGAFAPAGFGASYGVMNQALLGPNLYKSLGGMAKILPGLSYRVTDRLAIGGTVGIAFSYAELNGPYFVQSAIPGLPTVIDVHGFGVAPCGSVGLQYQLASDTVLGLCYTEQSNFNLRGSAAGTIFPGFPLPSGFDSKIGIKWPRIGRLWVQARPLSPPTDRRRRHLVRLGACFRSAQPSIVKPVQPGHWRASRRRSTMSCHCTGKIRSRFAWDTSFSPTI